MDGIPLNNHQETPEEFVVRIGCQKKAAYEQYKKYLGSGHIEAALNQASWNCCLDDQLMAAAPEEIQEAIIKGREGSKP